MRELADLDGPLRGLDRSTPFPSTALRVRRAKRAGTQRVALPPGYLEHLDDDGPPDLGRRRNDSVHRGG